MFVFFLLSIIPKEMIDLGCGDHEVDEAETTDGSTEVGVLPEVQEPGEHGGEVIQVPGVEPRENG